MIDPKEIVELAEKLLQGGQEGELPGSENASGNIFGRDFFGSDLFVVGVKVSPANEIELLIDSDTSVGIDSCVALSRAIEASLDREKEDFSLTVASAGIGQPLKVYRQYKKLIGKPVEVVLKNGTKIVAELRGAAPGTITLAYPEQVVVEGKKRKETVERVKEYPLEEVKWTKEYLDFK